MEIWVVVGMCKNALKMHSLFGSTIFFFFFFFLCFPDNRMLVIWFCWISNRSGSLSYYLKSTLKPMTSHSQELNPEGYHLLAMFVFLVKGKWFLWEFEFVALIYGWNGFSSYTLLLLIWILCLLEWLIEGFKAGEEILNIEMEIL